MNVLSCFDGISCGQIALNRAGIDYEQYFASEIDPYAIKVTMANYPSTVQFGDITKIDPATLPPIDLIIGGSPCQGFSFAGKQLNFDDPRSALFFHFADLIDILKPKYFLLENVLMKKWCERIISDRLQIEPILLNSARVSAQTRKRLYWTNIPVQGKPADRHIYLPDILEKNVGKKYFLSPGQLKRLSESSDLAKRFSQIGGRKAITSTARQYANWQGQFAVAMRGRQSASGVKQTLEPQHSGKTNCLTGVQKDNLIAEPVLTEQRIRKGETQRTYVGKSQTLTARSGTGGNNVPLVNNLRRLTEIESCRLQTVPDDYFYQDGKLIIAPSHLYRCLGNGWTVDIVAWILSFMSADINSKNVLYQQNLFNSEK